MKEIIYYDIETGPCEERILAYLDAKPFDPDEVKMGNLKDPEKIEAKLAAAAAHHESSARDKAALNPSTAEVLCVSVAIGEAADVTVLSGGEKQTLGIFWDLVTNDAKKIVNWTGNNLSGNFDLNILCRRSWALGVEVPVDLRELSYHGDLAQSFLAYADRPSYCGLERAARELGIEVEETPVTGADFYKWWGGTAGIGSAKDQRKAAMVYAKQDVTLLREIAKRIGGAQ